MGAPKRLRKRYEKPAILWNKERIDEEHRLKQDYGLRNIKEVWNAKSMLRNIRRNVRDVLAGRSREATGSQIVSRLSKYGIVKGDAPLESLLTVKVESLLDRRLQTIVFRKGMARSPRQARQLITHGFISMNGKRVTAPSYLVPSTEENAIGYSKPINLEPPSIEGKAGKPIQNAEAAQHKENMASG